MTNERNRFTDEQVDLIIKWYKKEVKAKDIAEKYGITVQAVYKWFKSVAGQEIIDEYKRARRNRIATKAIKQADRAIDILVDVMEGSITGNEVGHRINAAKEIIAVSGAKENTTVVVNRDETTNKDAESKNALRELLKKKQEQSN